MVSESAEVLTIGHSSQSYERFLEKLKLFGVTAVADVRTSPYSKQFPHFNRDILRPMLRDQGIDYAFLGKELGGRPISREFFTRGVADYEKMAKAEFFRKGIERVTQGAKNHRIALMCSEQDPLDCHRCLLVGRELARCGIAVNHILADDTLASQVEIENFLFQMTSINPDDLFETPSGRLAVAYRKQSIKVAFEENEVEQQLSTVAESTFG